ncbi:MAG: PilZ domain-containing protein [Magnetococcus sp. DMHC-6]
MDTEQVEKKEGSSDRENRRYPRRPHRTEGVLIIDENRLAVRLVDISIKGFGLLSAYPISPGTMVSLQLTGEFGQGLFSGLVAYCEEYKNDFRVGLSLFNHTLY